MANELGHEGQKTIKHTGNDAEKARELGLEGVSASTAHSDLLERAQKLEEIQEHQREVIRKQRKEIRQMERLYGVSNGSR